MILVDTSVWIDHIRNDNRHLAELLNEGRVLTHSLVVEELACGNLKGRSNILGLLADLPKAPQIDHDELLAFIELHKLDGAGLGAVDTHLLASSFLANAELWSLDKHLNKAAHKLSSSYLKPVTAAKEGFEQAQRGEGVSLIKFDKIMRKKYGISH